MKKAQNGFTVVETVVAVALTAVLLGFLLPVFLSVSSIYRNVADANLLQTKSINAIRFLKSSVQNASDVRILFDAPTSATGYAAIWCKDNKLYYQKNDSETAIYMQDTQFALEVTGVGQKLTFQLQILTDGTPYELESTIALQNSNPLPEQAGIGIQFKIDSGTS